MTNTDKAVRERVFLSPPHLTGDEERAVARALESNWVAPLGPNVDAFEAEFAEAVGASHAAALSSGTAGLHLALILAGVGPGDEVIVPTFTFIGSANPVLYVGARPVFVDSETESWNVDPALVAQFLEDRAARGQVPKALLVVHLYGQCADLDELSDLCRRFGVRLIEDAAEALGSTYRGRSPGVDGESGVFSFNGNKIITTSGGGMLVTDDRRIAAEARRLAAQARDPAPHYQHSVMGFNYRMSNLLAAVGRVQLAALPERVEIRRALFERYQTELGEGLGLTFQAEASWGKHSRWLSCLTVDEDEFGATREEIRVALEARNIESRPLWKPLHLQPLFEGAEVVGGAVSEHLFVRGLCLPSGSSLTRADQDEVIETIRLLHEGSR